MPRDYLLSLFFLLLCLSQFHASRGTKNHGNAEQYVIQRQKKKLNVIKLLNSNHWLLHCCYYDCLIRFFGGHHPFNMVLTEDLCDQNGVIFKYL